jgi:Recombination endonuclease VII
LGVTMKCSSCKKPPEEVKFTPSEIKRGRGKCSECKKEEYRRLNPAIIDSPETVFKKCTKCEEDKDLTNFRACKRGKFGTQSRCRNCEREEVNSRRRLNPQERRDKNLKYFYNMTQADYDSMLESQEGKCAICRTAPQNGKNLCVDHNHNCCLPSGFGKAARKTCGKCVRGLLCPPCNRLLGRVESGEILRFYKYLEEYDGRGS